MQPILSFTTSIIAIMIYLGVVTPSVSGKTDQGLARPSTYSTNSFDIKLARRLEVQEHPHGVGHNTTVPRGAAVRRNRLGSRNKGNRRVVPFRKSTNRVKTGAGKVLVMSRTATPTKQRRQNEQPTPEPTGEASTPRTVYITGPNAFALLLPQNPGEIVSDAEKDGVAFCTDGSGCGNPFPEGFITGASYLTSGDGSYVQITGCMDSSKFPFADDDDGGQFDVRYPNGALCTFGGYGASFIEL